MLSVPVVLDQSQVFSLGFYIFERAMRFVFVRFFVTSFMILFGQEFGNGVARVFSAKQKARKGFVRGRKSLLRSGFSISDWSET